jgi:hypothetical protein
MTHLEHLRGLTPLLFPCEVCETPMAARNEYELCDDCLKTALCGCGNGQLIVGGPVGVCLECELGPFGRAWEDEMLDRMEQGVW